MEYSDWPPIAPGEDMLCPKQVAKEYSGFKVETLEKWRYRYHKSGQLVGPAWIMIGGRPKYPRSWIEHYLEKQTLGGER